MVRHGVAPFLECSSQGNKRFSAFFAYVNGRSIEEQYQSAKIFPGGKPTADWRKAKGRKAVNQDQVARLYSHLWDVYISQNPELIPILCQATGLSDVFGKPGGVCQATELWRIRNYYLDKYPNTRTP